MGERGLRVLLALLALAGILISAYLTWGHLRGTVPVCVGDGSGCETVQTSRYSEILGVPVAALGLLAYAGLLLSAATRGERAVLFGLFVALIGTLFSAYLTWLELFVIRAICQWCVASAVLVTSALPLTVLRLKRAGGRRVRPGDHRRETRRRTLWQ
ncbi:vitamin K epoxide reductase [Rubrobacter tropicus]|uniref:Vitamin K epoxide reductase n=1 Tax=Rubrobacter tropicus TaxID=2653851 RepID=A0A6G8QDH7_9ACTN|nr:vitamin K epoxide reductase family protein [Rubrobacter tropicus]QIN84560.1 vitamin K epoxide reductase [Rubrobacter tropicus]